MPHLLDKADIHIHAETLPRLDQLIGQSEGRASYDWGRWLERPALRVTGGGK